jgi:hypothetical protein
MCVYAYVWPSRVSRTLLNNGLVLLLLAFLRTAIAEHAQRSGQQDGNTNTQYNHKADRLKLPTRLWYPIATVYCRSKSIGL